MLVRRQLQSAAQDSSGSLASIGEDTVVQNGSLERAASEDPNADLLKRQSTGAEPSEATAADWGSDRLSSWLPSRACSHSSMSR